MGLMHRQSPAIHQWRGAWAVVTGASSGIGAEFARQLGHLGVNIVLAARRRERLELLQEELGQRCGVHVVVVAIDLECDGGAEALFQRACADGRHIRILINNAGCGSYGPFTERLIDEQMASVDLNIKALTHLSHRFAIHMLAHGQPSYITHVSSIAAYSAVPYFAVYAGTKSYVRFFSEALRVELSRSNIHVTCVCPGGTATEFHVRARQHLHSFGHWTMMSCEEVVRYTLRSMVLKHGVVIPGMQNKLVCWLPRLLPERLAVRLAFMMMKRAASPQ